MRARPPAGIARLNRWAEEDAAAALVAYAASVDLLDDRWPRPDASDPSRFFETYFKPGPAIPALITGYYEPEIDGSEVSAGPYRHPLYAMPTGLHTNRPWYSRAEIEAGNLLAGSELIWLKCPVEAFFAQVQGSVRVVLPDGRVRRFGYAGRNGHEYQSIGAELVGRGDVARSDISAQAIRDWCAANPESVAELLRQNPSFVFFKALDLPSDTGPLGTMGRPVTAGRSIAVDPEYIALGSPVWVETAAGGRLMIAQDTGSAIIGPGRIDVFCGTGAAAGQHAGNMHDSGELVPFFPCAAGLQQ